MNRCFIILFSLIAASSLQCATRRIDAESSFNLEFAELIQKRYYLILRLEDSIVTLGHVQKTLQGQNSIRKQSQLLDCKTAQLLHHPMVKKAAEEIVTNNTLHSFKRLWLDFLSYKYIDDNLFVHETIVLLLLLYKNIVKIMAEPTRDIQSIELLLDTVDEPFGQAVHQIPSKTYSLSLIKHASSYAGQLNDLLIANHHWPTDMCKDIDCDNVQDSLSSLSLLLNDSDAHNGQHLVVQNSIRFYHIQRLLRSVFILSRRDTKHIGEISASLPALFNHERIRSCAQEIHESQNLTPVLKLWKCFATYDCIDDQLFLEEFIQLLIVMYNHLLPNSTYTFTSKKIIDAQASALDLIELYEIISALPIPELLDLLDDMSEQFAHINHEYELTNAKLSWFAMLKLYVRTSPVIVGAVVSTLLKHVRTLKKTLDVILLGKY